MFTILSEAASWLHLILNLADMALHVCWIVSIYSERAQYKSPTTAIKSAQNLPNFLQIDAELNAELPSQFWLILST